MKNWLCKIPSTLALIAILAAGCEGTTTTAYSYYDPYAYYGYYPTDVYYSGYYWTDPYSVYYYYAGTTTAATPVTGDAGTSGPGGLLTLGDAIRALALGQEVCPNQVTITPRTGPSACDGASATVRNGVTLQFNGCMLSDGGRIDGTFDVQATRTADSPCDANTTITVSHQTTITNLTYTGPGGGKLVIPNETGTSSFSYKNGQPPTSSALNLQGRMQVVNRAGTTLADQTIAGSQTVTPNDKTSYAVDGTLTLEDQLNPGGTTTVTATGLTRGNDCCRPTGGSLKFERTRGINTGTHTWTFGPSCGAATFDSRTITLSTPCL